MAKENYPAKKKWVLELKRINCMVALYNTNFKVVGSLEVETFAEVVPDPAFPDVKVQPPTEFTITVEIRRVDNNNLVTTWTKTEIYEEDLDDTIDLAFQFIYDKLEEQIRA